MTDETKEIVDTALESAKARLEEDGCDCGDQNDPPCALCLVDKAIAALAREAHEAEHPLSLKWRLEADAVEAQGYSQQADRMRDCADDLDALAREAQTDDDPSHCERPFCRRTLDLWRDLDQQLQDIADALGVEQPDQIIPAIQASPGVLPEAQRPQDKPESVPQTQLLARALLELWQELRPQDCDEWLDEARVLAQSVLSTTAEDVGRKTLPEAQGWQPTTVNLLYEGFHNGREVKERLEYVAVTPEDARAWVAAPFDERYSRTSIPIKVFYPAPPEDR